MSYITTLHDLIKDLERDSSVIGEIALAQQLVDTPLTDDLRVFANQDAEKSLIRTLLPIKAGINNRGIYAPVRSLYQSRALRS